MTERMRIKAQETIICHQEEVVKGWCDTLWEREEGAVEGNLHRLTSASVPQGPVLSEEEFSLGGDRGLLQL